MRRSSSSKAPATLPLKSDKTPLPPPSVFSVSNLRPSGAGAEPGANPHRDSCTAKFCNFKQECTIDVIDYDSDDATTERLANADFVNMMKNSYQNEVNGQPDHHPKVVRWINIGGIDWDVLSSMALRYHIHSLALEDVLHEEGNVQSKADYYPDHLFIRILCHSIYPPDEHEPEDRQYMTDFGYNSFRSRFRREPGAPPPEYDAALSPGVGSDGGVGTEQVDIEHGGNHRIKQGSPNVISPFSTPVTGSFPHQRPIAAKPSKPHFSLPRLHSPMLRTNFLGPGAWWRSGDQRQILKLRALTEGDRIDVRHEPMYAFLFNDGTVISIIPTPNLDFTAPIVERLYQSQSVLRTSEDASLLIEALLDLVVDRVLEVVGEYQKKIHTLEHDIMLNPSMDSVRSLHVLSGDLITHKMTLEPIKTMIYNLRRYDVDRCTTMANHFKQEAEASNESDPDTAEGSSRATQGSTTELDHAEEEGPHQPPADVSSQVASKKPEKQKLKAKRKKRKRDSDKAERLRWEQSQKDSNPQGIARGYLSYTSKVYLGDVNDHMDFALTCLEMYAGISQNLIDYAFNMASYQMNQVMSRLTLVTIIFLPLTLLTGYFGMNFEPFSGLDGNGVTLFWKIAAIIMAILIPLFMLHDLKNFMKYLSRRWRASRATKGIP